eukprot:TRINITY_DN2272_c0_g5_i1.p1 TRINITY_DN2272_c0_g5~~TRINITY_DN2272_c0_g5_i1.p1  ORF type:complete len:897 (-),score=178.37 TRINITY_DN2272_c0_g5_i1:167-2857(-)
MRARADSGNLEAQLRMSTSAGGLVGDRRKSRDMSKVKRRMSSRVHPEPQAFTSRRSESRKSNAGRSDSSNGKGFTVLAPEQATAPTEVHEGKMSAWTKCRRCCLKLLHYKVYHLIMFAMLMIALFLPDICVLVDRPDSLDIDIIMTAVLCAFLADIVINSLGHKYYLLSLSFWMDFLGTVSLIMDITYIPVFDLRPTSVSNPNQDGDSTMANVTRMSRFVTRAGRMARLMKLAKFMTSSHEEKDIGNEKKMAHRLSALISNRMTFITFMLVAFVFPGLAMLQYPTKDYSVHTWGSELQLLVAAKADPALLQNFLSSFDLFFRSTPIRLVQVELLNPADAVAGWPLPFRTDVGTPNRASSLRTYTTQDIVIHLDFGKVNQMDATVDVSTVAFVMLTMLTFSLMLSRSVNVVFLRPVERLLLKIRGMRKRLYTTPTTQMHADSFHELDTTQTLSLDYEAKLFMQVVQKLSGMRMMQKSAPAVYIPQDHEGEEDVFFGDAYMAVSTNIDTDVMSYTEASQATTDAQLNVIIESAGVSADLVNSWNLNTLELDKPRKQAAMLFFLSPLNFRGVSLDATKISSFLQLVEAGYNKVPFTNWFHAADVTHFLYRSMRLCSADRYLSSLERLALLVSAAAHDIGHQGLSNQFLIQKNDELALLYNDKSPVENMSCAKLFEITNMESSSIFSGLTITQKQNVREIIIDAIIHTDPAFHFDVVEELELFRGEYEDVIAELHSSYHEYKVFPGGKEAMDCFMHPSSRRLFVTMLLRYADISYTVKPFRICRLWALQALEEYFSQGDQARALGLPVSVMCNREKMNRSMVEMSFIDSCVAPFAFNVAVVCPPLFHLVDEMIENVKAWKQQMDSEGAIIRADERKAVEERIQRLTERRKEIEKTFGGGH